MKVLNFFRVALCALAVAFACSCQETKEAVITFPEATDVTIANGQELELTFNAEAAWKLTVDKDWIVFVEGEDTFQQLTGTAGSQTIKITTKDVTAIFEEEQAVISIEMDSKVQPLYNITRTAVARWAKMFRYEYGEAPVEITADAPLNLEYNEFGDIFAGIAFMANFDWKLNSVPEWIGEIGALSGQASEIVPTQAAAYAYLKQDALAFEKTGNITITDMEGNNAFSFPVTYAGMPEGAISITNSMGRQIGLWNNTLQFSSDAYVVEYNQMLGESTKTEETSTEVTVLTKGLDYEVYVLEYKMVMDTDVWQDMLEEWINVDTTTPGKLVISVAKNEGEERTAHICVLPRSLVPQSFDSFWFQKNFNELQSYTFAVKQEAPAVAGADAGVVVAWTSWQCELYFEGLIPCIPFSEYNFDGLTLMDFGSNLPADNTYVYELPESYSGPLVISPAGFPAEWYPRGAEVNLFRAIDASGANNFYTDAPNFSNGTAYENPMTGAGARCALQYSADALAAAKPGKLVIELYKDADEVATYRPSAALIIVKK